MNISDFIRAENAAIDLEASSKTRLLQTLSERAGKALGIDDKAIFAALHNREKLGSTGVGGGVAIPHAPVAGVAAPFGILARLKKPLDFEAIDETPVDIVCLLLTPPEGRSAHLNVLASIARRLRSPEVLARARGAPDASLFYAAIATGAQ